jgi:hypothetical protein
MTTMTASVIVAAGLATAFLVETPAPDPAAWSRAAVSCEPAAAPAVPADYLLYHALVAPYPATPPGAAGTGRLQASCAPHKVIRT